MARCYFDSDTKKGYSCEYAVYEEKIIIRVEYDIGTEIEAQNGVTFWSTSTTFKQRDLLIADGIEKKYLLVKNASYSGINSRIGSLDDISITSFVGYEWFESSDLQQLLQLEKVPKIKAIKIYSESIARYYRHPSVVINKTDDEIDVCLSKKKITKSVEINNNNIDSLIMGDDWSCISNVCSMEIDLNGYLEILLSDESDLSEVYKYIYELMVYMQLFYPGKFKISKIKLLISKNEYLYTTKAIGGISYSDKNVKCSVAENLLDFLKNCYINIPYRDIEGDVRNIPYVIMNSYRNIEDNFLILYRFIESRYKRKKRYEEQEDYIEEAFQEHYKKSNESEEWVKKQSKEIVCLRNHYAHEGYYIHNSVLQINYRKEKERNYEVNADAEWIYGKTKLLYLIVIDVIFTEMLNYTEYDYQKVF